MSGARRADGGRTRREVARAIGREARSAVSVADPRELAAVYLVVPTLLVGVALLPGSGAWRFSLAAEGVLTDRWTLWTAFASSYVHADAAHLANNVAVYWLLLGVAYPLSVLAGWRRRLASAAAVFLLVVPVVSAWLTLTTLGAITDVPSSGFSDVNNAFLGYLLVVWFVALDRVTDGAVDRRWVGVVAPASLGVVLVAPATVDYAPSQPTAAALLAVGAAAVAVRLRGIDATPDEFALSPGREFCFVAGASVFVAGLVGSLLVVPTGANVWAHLAGFVVGLATTVPTAMRRP